MFALVVIATSFALSCAKKAPPKAAAPPELPPLDVATAPIVRTGVERTTTITGTLFGREEATVAAKVGGRVAQVMLDVEDVAMSGDPIVQIDKTDYELAVAERKAALLAALAKVGLTQVPGPDFDPATVPTVERSRAESENAKAKLDRARSLFDQQPPLISEQDFADIRTQAEVARRSAEVELLIAGATLADARTQSAMIATAEQQLADTTVRAPRPMTGDAIEYRIAQRLVSLGELVIPGQAVARVVASDVIKFRGQVPEQYTGRVIRGRQASITVDAFDHPFTGVVTRVAPRIDSRTRTFETEIEIANQSGDLKPGGFARASIVIGSDENVTLVPPQAVVTFAGVQRVFSVKDGKAVEHRIQTGETFNGMIEILGDLKADHVVVKGATTLSNGRPVRVGT